MIKTIELVLPPEIASDDLKLETVVRDHLRIKRSSGITIEKLRRSVDARSRNPLINLSLRIFIDESPEPESPYTSSLADVSSSPEVIIVGSGPAGYFAALELIERGFRPVIFDRGKDVRTRRKDLRSIQQFGIVNPDSNYCFGEGGAGTYSDGKLYTRSQKRGDVRKALKILVEHGASSDILIDAHPHIGSNKLPGVVQNIRKTITDLGGEINFNSAVTGLIIKDNNIAGVIVNNSAERLASSVILSTGHSARDIFYLLGELKIRIEPKPFALGMRIEHPQELIDEIRYRQKPRSRHLPPASYNLTTQVYGRGVYSFCMCPGGLIVPAATSPGEIVVNGMSMSRRSSEFANAGIVVSITEEDLRPYSQHGNLRGLEFQRDLESRFFKSGDGSQNAPAQRITDFLEHRISETLPKTSYIPGVHSYMLAELLPAQIGRSLKIALKNFEKKMKGFITDEACFVGLESRTSSPVRIPREMDSLEHVEVAGLYPCGEGAGYAGGIISAALDGQNVARALAEKRHH